MKPAVSRSGVLAGTEDLEDDLPKLDFGDQDNREFQFLQASSVACSVTYQLRIQECVDIAERHGCVVYV